MELEFDNIVTIAGIEYFIKASLNVDYDIETHSGNYWGSSFSYDEAFPSNPTIETLEVYTFSEDDLDFNVKVEDENIIKIATAIVDDWGRRQ